MDDTVREESCPGIDFASAGLDFEAMTTSPGIGVDLPEGRWLDRTLAMEDFPALDQVSSEKTPLDRI